ncbi:MAG: phosphate acetyltransferase [Candidatus Aureabacteria bacterium]|jgi:phosphate acetyltransferase|nr:phosphate acetyltransferase [Candidatus Auribacterota bacterium]NLW94195.1 phosphate acetyltransferase [Chlamydiota bacterium]HOE26148.1 phosphate acetyltransferase [bacterium]HQM52906.1 phosphate acetyltransferase [bacterium]
MPEKSAFIEEVFTRAKKTPRRIVLPEGHDERIVKAAGIIARKDLARPIILGIRDRILAQLKSLGMSAEGIEIVNPQGDPRLDDFAKTFFELRRHKGVTLDQARETISSWVYFGTMMVYKGDADCLVCGATHSTRNTIMPALQIIKCKRGCSLVSSLFFMVLGKDVFAFADCGVIENPSSEQLAEIAVETTATAIHFGIPPLIALLSYSTKRSAASPLTRKIVEAVEIAKLKIARRFPGRDDIAIDGELQVDAAIVPAVAARKAADSPLRGKARVLIFPDLNSGNIGYKLVHRLARAEAYGPILQGLAKPVNDLSRGCDADDVVGVAAVTAVQSQDV